jgi:apolipoprotein N-acyltransferase
VTALLCALASALLFFLALGTADLGLLAWVAPVPVLWLAFGDDGWPRGAIACVAAYTLGQLGMLWPYLGAMGPLVLAISLGPALVFALVALAALHAARTLPAPVAVLVFPALWTGWEWLESTLSPHGTFGAWAYSQVSTPLLIQGASVLGLWVVSFAIASFAAGIALALRRRAIAPLVPGTALVLACAAFGAWRTSTPEGDTIRVAAAAREHDDAALPDAVARAEAAEARRLASLGARVVVFDEKAALLPRARRDEVLAPLVAAARETGITIVAGFDETGAERRNAAYTIGADGRVRRYTKRHHIPGLESGYTIGDGPGLLGAGEAVAICKDMDFQRTLRSDANAGSVGLMLVPAWDFHADGWLHARMAVMRGVEGGYAVVRAASNGVLTVSDARGRVLATRPNGGTTYASVIADVPMGTGSTPYLRIGDAFAWLAALLGIALVLSSVTPSPRRLASRTER